MITVIGGEYQGKLDYVLNTYNLSILDVFIFSSSEDEISFDMNKKVIYNFEELIKILLDKNIDPNEYINENIDKLNDKIIIIKDSTCGIVPKNRFHREYREKCGQVSTILAKNSEKVIRVFSGIGTIIKEFGVVSNINTLNKLFPSKDNYSNITPYIRRNLTVIPLNQEENVVITNSFNICDCNNCDPFLAGKSIARNAILQLLCSGAKPFVISSNASSNLDKTNKKILDGIHSEIETSGHAITISNNETSKSAIDNVVLTATGLCETKKIKLNQIYSNNLVFILKLQNIVKDIDLDEISCYKIIDKIVSFSEVYEFFPINIENIYLELETLSNLNKMSFNKFDETILDLHNNNSDGNYILGIANKNITLKLKEEFSNEFHIVGDFI